MQAKTFWLKAAWWILTALTVAAVGVCLILFVDFAEPRWPRASFGGFRPGALIDFGLGLATIALIGAAMHVNARRVARGAEGWRFIAALIGAAATIAMVFALSGAWLILSSVFETSSRSDLIGLMLGACVLPIVGCLGALGLSGLAICFASELPDLKVVLRAYAAALPAATAMAAAVASVAIARQPEVSSALIAGTAVVIGLGALTLALTFNLRRESGWRDVVRSLAGLTLGLIAIVIMSGVFESLRDQQDPRAVLLGVIFLGPLAIGSVPFFLLALLLTTGRTTVSARIGRALSL